MNILIILYNLSMVFPIAIVSAGYIDAGATLVGPSEPGTILKGPTNKATVKGPSGPKIVTAGDTGTVASGAKSGGVVSSSSKSPGYIASTLPLAHELVAPIAASEPLIYAQEAVPYEPQYAYAEVPSVPYEAGPQYTYAEPYAIPAPSAGYYGKSLY